MATTQNSWTPKKWGKRFQQKLLLFLYPRQIHKEPLHGALKTKHWFNSCKCGCKREEEREGWAVVLIFKKWNQPIALQHHLERHSVPERTHWEQENRTDTDSRPHHLARHQVSSVHPSTRQNTKVKRGGVSERMKEDFSHFWTVR